VVLTAALTAPVARYALGLGWTESLLVGSVVASTDAAAVFFLIHARGLRLRPRVGAILEIESGTNDPFAIFLTIMLVEMLLKGHQSWAAIALGLAGKGLGGALIGVLGGRAIVLVLNRLALPQGLHAPFVTTGALVVFGLAEAIHSSGFLAVYVAGLVVGNRPTRAHNTVVVFLDAATWLAQIGMFLLLGLLAWPERLPLHAHEAIAVALFLMLVARPLAVFICLAPFRFSRREKLFISWVGLRGAVGIFLASIPLLVNLPNAQLYFDVGFVVVLASLLVQGWTIAKAAHRLHIALPRTDPPPRRVELDLPGQLEQELVGYAVHANNPYLRRRIAPSWAKLMLVVRDERVHTPAEAADIRAGDHVYFLAPPEKAQALDRFFVDMPPPAAPDPRLLGDFFVGGDATLGALAEIYGLTIAPEHREMTLADHIAEELGHAARPTDVLALGPITLVVQKVVGGRAVNIGLQLAEPDPVVESPATMVVRLERRVRRAIDAMRALARRVG
jgi:cell volume regulation protein A